jgi:hypothetical protein
LLGTAVIDARLGHEARKLFGQFVFDNRGRVRPDAIGPFTFINLQGSAVTVGVEMNCAPAAGGGFPFQTGEIAGATVGTNEFWFKPIGPIAGVAVSAVGDNEPKFFRPGNFDVDGNAT